MRPDEFGKQVAAKWTRAEQVRIAFERGKQLELGRKRREAEREAKTQERLNALKHGQKG